MTVEPTPELRKKLRRLLDERIPENGSPSDTRFTDEELDEILSDSSSIYEAAAEGWTLKAAMFQRETGTIQSYSTGQESYTMTAPQEMLEYALKMAEMYREMASQKYGSLILKFKPPEVL